MNTVDILKQARALIADEKNWAQGAYATDAEGRNLCDPNAADACSFCSVGAVAKVLGIAGSKAEDHPAVQALDACTEINSIIGVNDEGDHGRLLSIWDEAIAHAEMEA